MSATAYIIQLVSTGTKIVELFVMLSKANSSEIVVFVEYFFKCRNTSHVIKIYINVYHFSSKYFQKFKQLFKMVGLCAGLNGG